MEPGVSRRSYGSLALAETARAMQALPSEQREALLLVAVEGMSYAEAAGVLGIPSGTLMSRLARARAALRRATDEDREAEDGEMSGARITERDLHAYVDGALEPARRAEVER